MKKPFKRIGKAGSLYEDVFREVKKAILSGIYGAGAPLPSETDLAGQFGVSRPVVREALRSLQSRGFIEIRRGTKGGAFVRETISPPLLDDFPDWILYRRLRVDHLAQARELLEPEIGRLAALNATEADIRVMRELVERTGSVASPGEKDRLYILFHRLVGRSCGNPLYAILMESIMDFTEGFIRTIRPVTDIIHHDHDHDAILDAIERRDPKRASEVASSHAAHILREMRRLEATYLALLEGRTPLDLPARRPADGQGTREARPQWTATRTTS